MTRWQYVALWLAFFIAARFFLVNPLLNAMDRVARTLNVLVDVVRHQ